MECSAVSQVLVGGGMKNRKSVCLKSSCKTRQMGAVRARTSAPIGSQFTWLSNLESEEYKDGLNLVWYILRKGCEFTPASRRAV